MSISLEQFETLKENYGLVSSWTIWDAPDKSGPKSNIWKLEVFNSNDILNSLKSDYVFVGLNAASHNIGERRCWDNFHSLDAQKSQDYKLRHALQGTRFWGSYITDALKRTENTNSAEVMRYIRTHQDEEQKQMQDLAEELSIIQPKCLIAIGNHAYTILNRNLGLLMKNFPELKLVKIKHYSCYISKERYRDEVLEALKDV